MCHLLLSILQRMSEIIHRVNLPCVTRIMMLRMQHPINSRVTHIHIPRRHIYFSPQHRLTLADLAIAHLLKQGQIFLNRSLPKSTIHPRMSHIPPTRTHLLWALLIHIRQALFNQAHRTVIKILKVIARKIQVLAPVKPKPLHILLDALHILRILLHRVRIIEPQMTFRPSPSILLSQPEVQTKSLRMSNMQKPIWLWRETRHRSLMLPSSQILRDDRPDKILAVITRFLAHKISV